MFGGFLCHSLTSRYSDPFNWKPTVIKKGLAEVPTKVIQGACWIGLAWLVSWIVGDVVHIFDFHWSDLWYNLNDKCIYVIICSFMKIDPSDSVLNTKTSSQFVQKCPKITLAQHKEYYNSFLFTSPIYHTIAGACLTIRIHPFYIHLLRS